jgi:murein hydrolase activator
MESRSSSRASPLLSAVLAAIASAGLLAQNRDSASQRVADRIRALQHEAEALATQESTLLAQLRKLEVERQLKTEELTQIESDRAATRQRLEDATRRAETLKQTALAQGPEVEARLVQIYKQGSPGYWRLLLDVDDLRSLGRAYRTAAALTRIDRDRIVEHQRTLDALAAERTELEARNAQLADLEERARRARAALDRAVKDRSTLVNAIDARRDLNAQMTGELQAAQQRLQTSVGQIDAAAAGGVLPLRPFQGALPWPARGPVITRFGKQPTGRFGTEIVRNGIEIGVTEGVLVRAVHEGVVAYADQFTGYGNLVIVEHGERAYSLYGHLSTLQVAKGDRVEAQTPLGQSGRTPNGNPAVYFELRVDGKAVDPLQWLAR